MMGTPTDAREALIVEAIGDVAELIDSADRLTLEFRDAARQVDQANAGLCETLATFDAKMTAITENAKTVAVRHIAQRTDDAATRSIQRHEQALADAARVALGSQLGAHMQRLQEIIQPLANQSTKRWESWLTIAGAFAAGASMSFALACWHFTV